MDADSEALGLWLADMLLEIDADMLLETEAEIEADSEAEGLWEAD